MSINITKKTTLMETKNKIQEGRKFVNSLITKSWKDKNFKKDLITSPLKTMEKHHGKPLKSLIDKKILVEDQTNTSFIYLNIPVKYPNTSSELTDKELDTISGGDFGFVRDACGIALCVRHCLACLAHTNGTLNRLILS